jgi:hypothetical protein
MSAYVECVCGKKYEVDRAEVQQFDCEGCGRKLQVPSAALEQKLKQLRERMQQSEPGLKDATRQLAELRNFHAVPLLMAAAQAGNREATNLALVGLADFPGAGHDVLTMWLEDGGLSMARFTGAMRDCRYAGGADYLCGLAEKGKLKENQIAEAALYLADFGGERALHVLRKARRDFPNLGGPLDDALARMRHLDESAGGIPDEAKRIPGRAPGASGPILASSGIFAPAEKKKGCLGLLLCLAGTGLTCLWLIW